jgi:hypothetical protein
MKSTLGPWLLLSYLEPHWYHVSTPTDPHAKLIVALNEDEIINVSYKEVIRSLMYGMILTHLDITYVVNCVA